MIKIIILMIASMLFSCASNSTQEKQGLTFLRAPIEFLSPSRVIIPKENYTKDIFVTMPTIPGGIFGNPSEASIYSQAVPEDGVIKLDLKEATKIIRKTERVLSLAWTSKGVSIVPKKTRLSRVGTFPFDSKTKKPIGGGGFINPVTKNNVILMYFDRACSIKGELENREGLFDHDIDIPSKGFHLIEVKKLDSNMYRLKRYLGGKVNFSIHVSNQTQT